MKVLIALDATPQCGEIVTEIASRPWPADTFFLLLHVLDPFPFARAPISLKRAKDSAEAQLKNAGRKLCGGGWAMEEDVVFGRARQEIAKIAGKWKADLVVVGSNEAGALTRLLLGSTARAVLRHASCAVEIVRPRTNGETAVLEKRMKVLVATDGSECSLAALRSVASRPWPEGSKFKVISIPEPFMPLGEFPQFELKEIEKLNTAAQKDARRYVDAGAEILQEAGLETSGETPLPRDSDAREIVKEAERWDAGMVVVGSHGRRGFDRLTMGSVSEHVALHAPCSVEVIRGFLPAKKKSKRSRRKE
jgi:nucleotide-binding universal stress UspA family protein